MTVGEKIQFFRKKSGLSQEELGQKMLVSRQTVSLWEMDKTLPTVDNLLRLKEIFSISVDDILSEAEPTEQTGAEPGESYVFQYEKTDLQEISKKLCLPLLKPAILFALVCIPLLVLQAVAEANGVVIGLNIGALFFGAIPSVKGYLVHKKAWKNAEGRLLQSTYSYEMFETYFVLRISRDGEVTKTLKISYDDVEKFQVFGNYLVLRVSGQIYVLKKDALVPKSALTTFCTQELGRVEEKQPKDIRRATGVLLWVLSVSTIWGALIGMTILDGKNHAMTENMWVFFLFLPVPIASIVYGAYLKKKGYGYKVNVIVGVIMAMVLCLYGSFTFIFHGFYSHDDQPIVNAERLLGIDIPEHTHINTQDWTKGTQSASRGYVFSTSDIYFEDRAVVEFEKNLPQDEKWITAIPNDLVGITSSFCDVQAGDCYIIIYNKDTGEFNKLPAESGTYVFINVLYDAKNNTMMLVEYQIEYVK